MTNLQKKMEEFYKHRGEHCESCDNYKFYLVKNYGKYFLYCTECGHIQSYTEKASQDE